MLQVRDGKRFITYCYDTIPVSRKSAFSYEKEGVHTYRRSHGRRTRYNKTLQSNQLFQDSQDLKVT